MLLYPLKRKSSYSFLFFLLFITFSAFSQENEYIPTIVPTAPDVASLMKYSEIPVKTYNGTTSFNVPIYELVEGDLSLPISINYYSNGIKVEEEASRVGLGWSLSAGGVIQHIPKGRENSTADIIPYGTTAADINDPDFDYMLADWRTNTIINGSVFYNKDREIIEWDMSDVTTNAGKGKAYEMYRYNFGGYSGKFIKDDSGNYVSIDQNNIRLESYQTNGLKAIAPDGVQYIFTVIADNIVMPESPCSPNDGFIDQSYTYYLTKIISTTNKEINFSYVASKTLSVPHFSQYFVHKYNPIPSNDKNFLIKINEINAFELTEINTENTKIVFTGTARQDLYNNSGTTNNNKTLGQVKVYSQNNLNTPVKTVNFYYDYFEGDSSKGDFLSFANPPAGWGCGVIPGSSASPASVIPTVTQRSKRLKLESVVFYNADDPTNSPRYTFEYNATPLPYKTSLAQDIWGFYNGMNNTDFLPNLNNLGYYDPGVPSYFFENPIGGSSRGANETYTKAGILETITYPTGGHTKIEYELNNFGVPSTVSSIGWVTKRAVDYNNTSPQAVEFTIPSLANQAPIISVWTDCNDHIPCDAEGAQDGCLTYAAPSYQNQHPNDNRLYCLLERKIDGNWVLYNENIYDAMNTQSIYESNNVGVCGIFNKPISLPAGTYRITANFPDNKTGYQGGPWASIEVKYLDYLQAQTYTNTGAGLRVKEVANYDLTNEKYNHKIYSYHAGLLMTKPIFYSGLATFELLAICGMNPVPVLPDDIFEGSNMFDCPKIYPHERVALQSDAVSPYTYSADGSLVGYSTVHIEYGENIIGEPTKILGRETFKYDKLQADRRFPAFSEMSGIPGSKIFGSGMLTEKITEKVVNPGISTISFTPVKKEKYEYELRNLKQFWAFKCQYVAPQCDTGNMDIVQSTIYNFFHFYPIKSGKVRLKKKTTTDYSLVANGTPTETLTTTTSYLYNYQHQLTQEKSTDSNGDTVENNYFYPNDLLAENQGTQMQSLVDENRINTPVRTVTMLEDKKISEQLTQYVSDNTTGNILLPKSVYVRKGEGDITFSQNEDRKITYTQYDTDAGIGNGNILEYSLEDGTPVSIVWGYNKTLPIAEIKGANYSEVTSYVANLQLLSDSDIDNCLQSSSCTEQDLRNALDNLRSALPEVMVTTYTYDPLVGVTSITDPRGYTIYYEYDRLNRLKSVKDKEGNILEENEYNYKPNN